MKISEQGLDLIRSFEGRRLAAYWDADGGVWTIGYGHTKGVKKGMRITKAQAEQFLLEDVAEFEALVNEHVKVELTQGQFDALVSIVFNVGPGSSVKSGIIRLKSGQPSTLLRRLNEGDYVGAALAFKDWVYAGGRKMAGLARRREAEFQMFMGEAA